MKRQIELNKNKIDYTLRINKQVKGIKFAIYNNGELVITTPRPLRDSLLEKLIVGQADWIIKKISHFKSQVQPAMLRDNKNDYKNYKQAALILAQTRLEYFNQIYGFKYNRISIRNQKTRWGSCSRKGNLNFNYKIALLPKQLADYIIVHELCHLKEFNHSPKFWNLVARMYPNYLSARKELRKIGRYNLV
ncbi:MAG: M48 family metallopeptidase [Patescibacteria group bacterium]|nr:M48 family metallopeptidase [Patescibacteria group bacterium]